MQPPKSDICVICGVRPADTVDHVPPKGFFKGVVNAQLRTVPCCRQCNNGASSDDDDLRFYISAQVGKQNPASKELWDNGAYKTILRKTKLREKFLANAREVSYTEADGTVSSRVQFHVPVSTYQRVFERTTRGLYFYHSGRILPANVPVSVDMLVGKPDLNAELYRPLIVESVGGGAFVYRYGIVPDDVIYSLWVYEFHQAHWALVTTGGIE